MQNRCEPSVTGFTFHGAGDDRKGPMPNVVRAVLGEAGGAGWDRVVALETNLDDLAPEHFDYLMERLLEAGALDATGARTSLQVHDDDGNVVPAGVPLSDDETFTVESNWTEVGEGLATASWIVLLAAAALLAFENAPTVAQGSKP